MLLLIIVVIVDTRIYGRLGELVNYFAVIGVEVGLVCYVVIHIAILLLAVVHCFMRYYC